MNNAIDAIKWSYECAGFTDQTKNSCLTSLQEAAKRKASRAVNKKEPISKDVLIELCDTYIDESDLLMVKNMTIIFFCFAGFLIFNEVSSLKFKDVHVYDN